MTTTTRLRALAQAATPGLVELCAATTATTAIAAATS
jgi:hypothetical protein